MGCNYLLTNVKMDKQSRHYMLFATEQERNACIIGDNHFSDFEINFNFGNRLSASCVVNDYNNENYMVISQLGYYHFYFIDSSQYISANQWRLNLTLDVITTYLTGANIGTFSPCRIERAHCNRFEYTDSSKTRIKFAVYPGSNLVKSETKMATRTSNRIEVKQRYGDNSVIDIWLKENILCWCYIYVDTHHSFVCVGNDGPEKVNYEYEFKHSSYVVGRTAIDEEYSCLCVPIYKNSGKILMRDDEWKICGYIDDMFLFRQANDNNAFIYNIKYSMRPPVYFDDLDPSKISVASNGDLVLSYPTIGFGSYRQGWNINFNQIEVMTFGQVLPEVIDGVTYRLRTGSLFVNVGHVKMECEEVETYFEYDFPVNYLFGNRLMELEPKLLLDCNRIVLRDSSNGEYAYNPLFLNSNRLQPMYDEPNNITNTNYYFRLKPTGIMSRYDDKNWTGLINTVDYSQQTATDNYANFLANNKNFLLTKGLQILPSMFLNLLSGNIGGMLSNGIDVLTTSAEIDNLKYKENALNNVNDSVELNMMVNEGIKLYVDIDKAYEVDVNRYYEYLYKYGYKVDIIDNPYSYMYSRHYFNYLQCEIEKINLDLPLVVINELKTLLSNGITLWHDYQNMYNFYKENYEHEIYENN